MWHSWDVYLRKSGRTGRSGSPRRSACESRSRPRSTRSTRPISARRIAPLFNQPGVEYVGEIDERSKSEFLGQASALLFPIDWPEPFGLSMIEAMACGTPVLAFRCGSVPEIVDPGVTGMIVDTMDEAIRVLPQVLALDRARSAAKIRAAIFGRAHGQGLCPGISFARQAAGAAGAGRSTVSAPAGA